MHSGKTTRTSGLSQGKTIKSSCICHVKIHQLEVVLHKKNHNHKAWQKKPHSLWTDPQVAILHLPNTKKICVWQRLLAFKGVGTTTLDDDFGTKEDRLFQVILFTIILSLEKFNSLHSFRKFI